MIRAVSARLVFALAALAAVGTSAGLAAPRHQEVPGTPLYHAHVLGAYRFGFLLPDVERPALSPQMARLHRTLLAAGVPPEVMAQMPVMDEEERSADLPIIKSASLSPIQDLAIEFALLVVLVVRLARPTLRAVAEFLPPQLAPSLWRLAPALPPPRLVALP